ncbi:hypothetical protein G6011_02660 [Alternaria panax]|uniref:Uncharacterized protein n=1 Tax=Alternaria panax TaxID=48097 RepID=A0AAD4I7X0_9PLEO|nr:hypothetical protein G6011_02660 [Alternaria panax]
MTKFPIHVRPNSRYKVFDTTGRILFNVIFGLRRLQKSDMDPRPILVETAGSVFGVPYALTHGLLTLYGEHPGEATQWVELDVSSMGEVDVSSMGEVDVSSAGCISVPVLNPLEKEPRRNLTAYLCAIDLHEGDQEKFADSDEGGEEAKLVNSYSHGHAAFKVVDDLTFPPRLEIRMRLVKNSSLEVTVVNTGSETQRHSPTSSLFIVNAATGKMVIGHHTTSICHLRDLKADLRPKVDDLVILKPETSFVNVFDIGWKTKSLQDGRHKTRIHPKGCRWWCGELEKEEVEGDKVPAHAWKSMTVPIMLDIEEELDITIKDGKVDGSV